jgi:hypothetical protein
VCEAVTRYLMCVPRLVLKNNGICGYLTVVTGEMRFKGDEPEGLT